MVAIVIDNVIIKMFVIVIEDIILFDFIVSLAMRATTRAAEALVDGIACCAGPH